MGHKVFSLIVLVAALAACQSATDIDAVSGATSVPVVYEPVVYEPVMLLEALPEWVFDETNVVYWSLPEKPEGLIDDIPVFVIDTGLAPLDAK